MGFKFVASEYPPFYPTETTQDDATFTVHNIINGKVLPTRPFLWAIDPSGTILPLQVKSCSKWRWAKKGGQKIPVGLDEDFSGSADESSHMAQILRRKARAGWVLLRDCKNAAEIERIVDERQAKSQQEARDAEARMHADANYQAEVTAKHLEELLAKKRGR